MSVLKISKMTIGRPPQGRQGSCRPSNGRQDLNVFFFEFAKRSLTGGVWREGGLSPPPRATGGLPPYISPGLHASIPFSFEPKNCTKNSEKKRGVRRRKAAKLCRIAHL